MTQPDDDSVDLGATPVYDPNATIEEKTGMQAADPIAVSQATQTGGYVISRNYGPQRKAAGAPNEDAYSAIGTTINETAIIPTLKSTIVHVEKKYHNTRKDGTTVATAVIAGKKVYTANIGDAAVIAFIHDPKNDHVHAIQITKDHVMSDEAERALMPDPSRCSLDKKGNDCYVNKAGNRGTNLSRAIGDCDWGLNHTIDPIRVADFEKSIGEGKNVYVVVCSDGIKENNTLEDMAKLVEITIKNAKNSTGEMPALQEIAANLIQSRHEDGELIEHYNQKCDDATVVIHKIEDDTIPSDATSAKSAKLITVTDGHGFMPENKYECPLSQIVAEEMPALFNSLNIARRQTTIRR